MRWLLLFLLSCKTAPTLLCDYQEIKNYNGSPAYGEKIELPCASTVEQYNGKLYFMLEREKYIK